MKKCVLAICTLMVFSAGSLLALSPCPTANAVTSPGDNSLYRGIGGCNVVITFNLGGSITTTIPNANPYDGVEDTMVGIVNNSASVITSVFLSSTTLALFGFDADGICAPNGTQPFLSGADFTTYCPHGSSTTNGNDYLGQASSFSGIAANFRSGTVNFAGIATGGTAMFSLEEPPSLNFQVNVPEPASIALLGTVVMFVSFRLRRRKANV